MAVTVTVSPTSEPISLAEAKAQIRYTADDQDALISAYITTAREYCERFLRRTIPAQTCKLTLDTWGDHTESIIQISNPPLVSISSIKYFDTSGNLQTLSPSAYCVDAVSQPGRVAPVTVWPSIQDRINAIEITFTCGYSTVPQGIKHAIRMLVADYWLNREATTDRGMVNPAVDNLLSAYRSKWGV